MKCGRWNTSSPIVQWVKAMSPQPSAPTYLEADLSEMARVPRVARSFDLDYAKKETRGLISFPRHTYESRRVGAWQYQVESGSDLCGWLCLHNRGQDGQVRCGQNDNMVFHDILLAGCVSGIIDYRDRCLLLAFCRSSPWPLDSARKRTISSRLNLRSPRGVMRYALILPLLLQRLSVLG